MMDVVVVGDEATVTGFRLGGIKRAINGASDTVPFEKLLEDSSIGVLIITERVAEKHRETLIRLMRDKKSLTPVVVEIADHTGPMARERDPIKELVRRVLGAEIEEEEV